MYIGGLNIAYSEPLRPDHPISYASQAISQNLDIGIYIYGNDILTYNMCCSHVKVGPTLLFCEKIARENIKITCRNSVPLYI